MRLYIIIYILMFTGSIYSVDNYIYMGCFEDGLRRDLNGLTMTLRDMVWHQCVTLCKDWNFHFAGLQAGTECYCGNSFGAYGQVGDWECNYQCAGNHLDPSSSKTCGGGWRNSVYRIPSFEYPKPFPTTSLPFLPSYLNYLGCFMDDSNRDLNGYIRIDPTYQSIELCIGHCKNKNFRFAGLQNGNECYCGNSYGAYGRRFDWECKRPCFMNNHQICGDLMRNSVYEVPQSYITRGDHLFQGEVLHQFHQLQSNNGQYTAAMQDDGNFVVYNSQGHALWSSRTVGRGDRLVMQHDGNLVIYMGITATWSSRTVGRGGHLVMQHDGNLVIYNGNTATWYTRTNSYRYSDIEPRSAFNSTDQF